jgi:multiple sugar transport system substrate-binding protein
MTSFEAQKIEAMERSTLPTVSKVYDDAEVQAKLPFLADVKDAADNAAPRPQVKDYPTISTIFQEYFHKALTGDMDNDAAMTEMDTKLNAALAAM